MKQILTILLVFAGIMPLKAQKVKPDTIMWVVSMKDSSKRWAVTNYHDLDIEMLCDYDTSQVDTQFCTAKGCLKALNDSGLVIDLHSEHIYTYYRNGIRFSGSTNYPYPGWDPDQKAFPKRFANNSIRSIGFFYQNRTNKICEGLAIGFMTGGGMLGFASPFIAFNYSTLRFNKPLLTRLFLSGCALMTAGIIPGVFAGKHKDFYFNDPFSKEDKEWYLLKHKPKT